MDGMDMDMPMPMPMPMGSMMYMYFYQTPKLVWLFKGLESKETGAYMGLLGLTIFCAFVLEALSYLRFTMLMKEKE